MYRLKGHFLKTATSKDMVGVPGLPVANWRIGSAGAYIPLRRLCIYVSSNIYYYYTKG